jgi:hypothetical protein
MHCARSDRFRSFLCELHLRPAVLLLAGLFAICTWPVEAKAGLVILGDDKTAFVEGEVISTPTIAGMSAILINEWDFRCGFADAIALQTATSEFQFTKLSVDAVLNIGVNIRLTLVGTQFTGMNAPPGFTPLVSVGGGFNIGYDISFDDYQLDGTEVSAGHVLTAATHGGSDTIVDFELDPFPDGVLADVENFREHQTPGTLPALGINQFLEIGFIHTRIFNGVSNTFVQGGFTIANGQLTVAQGINPNDIQITPGLGFVDLQVNAVFQNLEVITETVEQYRFEHTMFARLRTECIECIPEPGSLTLASIGGAGLVASIARRRLRRKRGPPSRA